MRLNFDNSYARLPARFYARLAPTPVSAPRLIRVNHAVARLLAIDPTLLESPDGVQMLGGNRLPEDAEPLAMAYAGHQFGNWVPQLGDGRAILLGEIVGVDGVRRDMQLKGAGRTPFSRGGDGRAVLGPVLREYIVSEAMAALGVPTTRALAAVTSGDAVMRQGPQPGAILTRVAQSHVRIGTFEYFGNRDDVEGVRTLADYVIARHYPQAAAGARPYETFLTQVMDRTADLVAQWLSIGFIHGVMNTDNMSVAGETIDFGPCAFMDRYHPETVYSSIDRDGRYAYRNQPPIAHWNLSRLAQALLPLFDTEEAAAIKIAQAALDTFPARFQTAYLDRMSRKLGLQQREPGDLALLQGLLEAMAAQGADFTLTFRALCEAAADPEADAAVREQFTDPAAFDDWATRWHQRLAREAGDAAVRRDSMRRVNPVYIPRNHRIEQAIVAATAHSDFKPFDELMNVLSTPYDEQPALHHYREPPAPHEEIQATFCGT